MYKSKAYLLLTVFALIIVGAANAQSAQKIRFADQVLLGMHVGYARDYVGEWNVQYPPFRAMVHSNDRGHRVPFGKKPDP